MWDDVDGGPARFLVDFWLQLRIKLKTHWQNSMNNFKEDSEDRGWTHWLRRLIPNIYMLHPTLLQLSHLDAARASLPQDTSRVIKRVHVQLATGSLQSGRQALWRPGYILVSGSF